VHSKSAKLIASFMLALGASTTAFAQKGLDAAVYPDKPIRMVVPYASGGTADVLAQMLAKGISENLNANVYVDNKPGAGTAIGARDVARANPDGYTIIMGTISSHAVVPLMDPKTAGYDAVKDFVAVAPVADFPYVLLSKSTLEASSIPELKALAARTEGGLAYASAGVGTTNHLAGTLLTNETDIKLLHVPYKGNAPAMVDLIAGEVDLMFELLGSASDQSRHGRVRAVAIAAPERSEVMPETPTFIELGLKDFVVSAWFGIFAPANTPNDIVEKLNASIQSVVEGQDFQNYLQSVGGIPLVQTADQFQDFIKKENDRWRESLENMGSS